MRPKPQFVCPNNAPNDVTHSVRRVLYSDTKN